MRKIGYARVSTADQNLDRQIIALQEAGCEIIYQEKVTGTKIDRPELQNMIDNLQEGDVVIVKELTRVSRSTKDMLDLVQTITEKGCFIKSINESWLDTSSPSGKLMLTIFAGMSQFENELRSQRCSEGREVAMDKGVQFGRPKKNGKNVNLAIELYKQGDKTVTEICDSTGVSRTTLWRRLKEQGLV